MPKRKQGTAATPIMKRPAVATETGTQGPDLDATAEETSVDKGKKTDLDKRIAGFK